MAGNSYGNSGWFEPSIAAKMIEQFLAKSNYVTTSYRFDFQIQFAWVIWSPTSWSLPFSLFAAQTRFWSFVLPALPYSTVTSVTLQEYDAPKNKQCSYYTIHVKTHPVVLGRSEWLGRWCKCGSPLSCTWPRIAPWPADVQIDSFLFIVYITF